MKPGDTLPGRDRVQALRHVRLPLRPHRGCAARPGLRRRPRRLRRRHGRAEGGRARRLEGLGRQGLARTSGSTSPRSRARPSSPAISAMTARAWWSRWSRTARASRRAGAGDKVVILTNQTPFYGESGGQIGDTGTDQLGQGLGGRCRGHVEAARQAARPSCGDPRGRGRGRRRRPSQRRRRAPRRRSAPITAPPICSTPRCASGSATMSRRRAAWSRRTISASISRIPSR